jgi:conjugal transfer pilus assembly protein TraB
VVTTGNAKFNMRTGQMQESEPKIELTMKTIRNPQADEAKNKKDEFKTIHNHIPAGTFTKGVILGGIDAPTGGSGKSDPHPVLIRLTENSFLPNKWRRRTKSCFVIAAGHGDLASERAYMRTEALSCVLENGYIQEIQIKGYVSDETGRAGVRGKLVSKQGQLISNAFLAGLGSGFGDTIASTAGTTSTSPLGSTQTFDADEALRAGAYGGVGNAMNRIADFYIKLADQTFPIVEVAAGRTVTVVLTKGAKLDDVENKKSVVVSDVANRLADNVIR